MNRIVHFEIQATEPEKAIEFYKSVFGWEFEKVAEYEVDYWMIMTAPKDSKEPGINGGLLKRNAPLAANSSPNAFYSTIQVENIDETIEKILAVGGTEAMPKFDIMGMAWQAYYKDIDGNIFGIHEAVKKAE